MVMIENVNPPFPLNSRVKVSEDYGTVKYYGEIKGYSGFWIGVEWDVPGRGKHSGTINNMTYFETSLPGSGSLVRPSKLPKFQTVADAIEERYVLNIGNPVDENLMREAQASFKASIFEFVGVEKIMKKQSHRDDLVDISVAHSTADSAGFLKPYCNLVSLNLTGTLIWNWHTVADIAIQLPSLESLNLSQNRLVIPGDEEIEDLEPSFRHLKEINLSNSGLKNWADILHIAGLWPQIQSLSLQNNDLTTLSPPNCDTIFKNLQSLDLHHNKLGNFDEILKLGNIRTLKKLLLMNNGIGQVQFPDCDPADYVTLFPNLEEINLRENPIQNEIETFNELDKLEKLSNLCQTANERTGFEEMFSRAVAFISTLKTLNKIQITPESRRDAEIDIWKQFGMEYVKSTLADSSEKRLHFQKKHRSYSRIVKKYGSPEELMVRPEVKQSNVITLNLVDVESSRALSKRVPRKMAVQTLQGLVIKLFQNGSGHLPTLSYVDAEMNDIHVVMDNMNKSLDFYSIQDRDTVLIKW